MTDSMQEEYVSKFDSGVMLLTHRLRERARMLTKGDRARTEELRLRINHPMTAVIDGEERMLGNEPITGNDISGVLDIVTAASLHSVQSSMKYGYITARGGYRIGLCGTALVRAGETEGLKNISSLALRIPKEAVGIGEEIAGDVAPDGEFVSTLIVSPPGGGKTTLLRDMIRLFSDGSKERGIRGMRIGVADERSEIAGMCDGAPQMAVGCRTDVMDGCPKRDAVTMLLKTMNPQIIAMDEITAQGDVEAISGALNCGVKLMATAHGSSLRELRRRKEYGLLFEMGAFQKIVTIERRGSSRYYTVCDFAV